MDIGEERDRIVSEFLIQSKCDPTLARIVLEESGWDLISALKAVNMHKDDVIDNSSVIQYRPSHKTSNSVDSGVHSMQDGQSGRTDKTVMPLKKTASDSSSSSSGSEEKKKLSRGFSKSTDNEEVVSNARRHVAKCIAQERHEKRNYCHVETPSYTFTLPDFAHFNLDFRKFLERDLIESSTMKALEGSGHLNWWAINGYAQKLWPLATSGDGNCLLHAASLGMWGFHDRLLMLRKALYLILTKGSRRHALWRRWRWQQTHTNKQAGLIYSEKEWREEWESLLRLASPKPRSKPNSAEPLDSEDGMPNRINDGEDATYESLEDIHVFALAHVLKRPVVVVSDTVLRDSCGEALAPVPFGGIYLPFECSPCECHRTPLVLSYDAAHFSALVRMQHVNSASSPAPIVPITTRMRRLLPVHFACDPGPDFTWWNDDADNRIARMTQIDNQRKLQLICKYMDVIRLPERRSSNATMRPLGESSGRSTSAQDSHITSRHNYDHSSTLSGSTGILNMKKERNQIQKIAHNLKKKFYKGKTGASRAKSEDGRNRMCVNSNSRLPVSLNEVQDMSVIVGARLHHQNLHHFMEEMIDNYLRAARGRFKGETTNNSAASSMNNPRSRISRSLSTSSLIVTCMNGNCDQPASHSTNFLCDACFCTQKEMMASFRVPQGPLPPSQPEKVVPEGRAVPAPKPETISCVYPCVTVDESSTVDRNVSSLVVRRQDKSETDTYGVSAVTNQMGVTRYFFESEVENCRSPHCANYSNGFEFLCRACTKM